MFGLNYNSFYKVRIRLLTMSEDEGDCRTCEQAYNGDPCDLCVSCNLSGEMHHYTPRGNWFERNNVPAVVGCLASAAIAYLAITLGGRHDTPSNVGPRDLSHCCDEPPIVDTRK